MTDPSPLDLPVDLRDIALLPGDNGYRSATATFFRGGSPAVILEADTNDHVQSAVRFAVSRPDLKFSVRSGGHGIAGRSTNTGGVILDLGHLNSIENSIELLASGDVQVSPGYRWLDVARFLEPHGLGISSGDYGGVGVGVLATVRGSGWSVREHGLTIGHEQAVEMILVDGSSVGRAGTTTLPAGRSGLRRQHGGRHRLRDHPDRGGTGRVRHFRLRHR